MFLEAAKLINKYMFSSPILIYYRTIFEIIKKDMIILVCNNSSKKKGEMFLVLTGLIFLQWFCCY